MTVSTAVGSSCAGFTLKEFRHIDEIDSDVYLFTHDLLGCPLLAIKNDDNNKTFTTAFNTIPTDSTGVAHILEHSVLMGSKKYPVKDVFGEINKGSTTTFLNAMTGSDVTFYPFATRNLKEYFNIMDVYCDVVFHPLLAPTTFEQEGWHYHAEKEQPLQFQGVVYNEMKGAFSDPIRHLFFNIYKNLMPGSTWAHESGGDPQCIPDLTYEDFVSFHKRHYHPSNSIFFLYGNAPLEEELTFLQDRFLSHFKEKQEPAKLEEGTLINTPVTVEASYAVDSTDLSGKTFLAVGTSVGSILDRTENMAFQVIANILYNSDASPLKNAIIESGVCKDFGGLFLATGCIHTLMVTYLVGSEAKHREAFIKLYDETLRRITKEGLDRELVTAELNKFEFGFREEASNAQRGLGLINKALNGLKYGGDPLDFLESEDLLAELRHKALEEGYFEELIRRNLLDNPATVTVVLKPDPGKLQEDSATERERLEKSSKEADEAEKERRLTRTAELTALQLESNSPETLALLPALSLSNMPQKVDYHSVLPTEMFGQEVLVSQLPTNHISYINAGFNTSALNAKQLKYLDLFATIACEIGTERLGFQQFAKELATTTGAFDHSFSCYGKKGEKELLPVLWFHLKALPLYLEPAVALMAEVFSSLSLADRARIRDIVSREFTWTEHSVQSEGYSIATSRIFSHLSPAGRCNELVNGASSYLALKELAKNYNEHEEQFLHTLKETARLLFNRDNLLLAVTGEEEELTRFADIGKDLTTALGSLPLGPPVEIPGLRLPTHEAFITAAEVVFAGLGGNLLENGEGYNGSFEVLKTWLNRDYLWNTVRQMGGAYGCFSQFSFITGNICLISYRDPQVRKTYEAYDGIPQAVASLDLSSEGLRQLITGTFGTLDPHQNPAVKGATARNEYLSGITPEFKSRRLSEALATDVKQMRAFAPAFEELMRFPHRAIIGNRKKIEEDDGLFDSFVEL